ncbi:MAG: single-stranded-DNA-specific exonuclease RecJ [Bryobacterales bacterium]|nr:single-stranded-DNA-specific exonuclease RecJ [Bryobacterales bacterium]
MRACKLRPTSRWVFPDPDPPELFPFAEDLKLPLAAARLLWRRGYRDVDAASHFLEPKIADMHDPFLLRDMGAAVDRIRRAISGGERMDIHGDYDVDGVTSTVVLLKALEMAGGTVGWHIPHRLHDGYGMQPAAVDEAASRGVKLIISVDNGIRAAAALARARELGIDVVVTDHHLPETELPPAVAIVNPNRLDCSYPNPNLCGAGVTLKLAHAVLAGLGWPEAKLYRILESFLKLVAIATVADIVPLTGENRIIVRHGLAGLSDARNPGLKALLENSGFGNRVPNATEVGFRIAPAINASGRMDSAGQAVRLFLTSDPAEADRIAKELFALNTERQAAERAIVNEILDRCLATPVVDSQRALIFWGEGWHRGVVGIVASRVMQRYHRPAIVLGVENGVAQGSGRSTDAFHLLDALESMRELFHKFGGHAHAAGLTLGEAQLDEFKLRLCDYAGSRLSAEDMMPVVQVDGVLEPSEADERLLFALEKIAPFGMHNPRPIFAFRSAGLSGPAQPWKERHLKIMARKGGRNLLLKAFGMGDQAEAINEAGIIDVTFELERDWYGGVGLLARDWRCAAVHAPSSQAQSSLIGAYTS